MDTAIKDPVPDRVIVIFDIRGWASECPDVKNYKWRLNRSGAGYFIAVPIW